MNPTHAAVLLPILASSAFAQSYWITMPNENSLAEGASYSPLFEKVGRLQQGVGDLHGSAKTFLKMAFQRDALLPANAAYVSRTLEVEIKFAKTNLAAMTQTFATNPTNSPNWTARPSQQPAPYDFVFTFDTPYAYDGTTDFLWDLAITATSAPASAYPIDMATQSGIANGRYYQQGVGCSTPLGTMDLRSTPLSNKLQSKASIAWSLEHAPGNAACALLIGTANPAMPVTGLCGKLYVTPETTLNFATSAAGAFTTPTFSTPWNGSITGVKLQAQAAAVDATKSPIPVSVSNGLSSYFGWLPASQIVSTTVSSYGNPTATTGFVITGQAIVTTYNY